MLEVGTKAPDFTLPDINEKLISLKNFKGQKVVLWFFPKANTPGWTVEGKGFRAEFKKFKEKNYAIIGMSADPPAKQKKFAEKQEFQYPLLCDEEKNILKAYHAWGIKKLYGREYEGIKRISYLIDEDGKILKAYEKVKTKSHAQDVLADIDDLD